MRKLFGEVSMSWPVVIVFALAAGFVTGIITLIPALEPTSFHDIAVSFEWWVVFAFVIACNCQKNWECALKTFVFFLISQPLVYLVQVIAGTLDTSLALTYYSSIWGPATLLTLPGGFIAFYIQKQNVLGAVILGLGCAIEGLMGASYAAQLVSNPPYHLLTVIVCFGSILVFAFCIQKENKNRAITLGIAVVVTIGLVAYVFANGLSLY